jgi:endonuclease-8
MPEGDSIFRAAATLHQALAGRAVLRFESVFPQLTRVDSDTPLRGRLIEQASARGKHLLIRFSGDLVLRTHMRMHGSWHLYRPGERWQRPASHMRIIIATDAFEAIAFQVPVAEFVAAADIDRALRGLGPDLLAAGFDAAAATARLRLRPDMEIGEALLDQAALAGIGNIWKSEALFRAGVNPFTLVRDIPDHTLGTLVATAARLLRVSATGGTDPRRRPAVYMRGGQPCRRCGTLIMRAVQGEGRRSTYWCPACQPR